MSPWGGLGYFASSFLIFLTSAGASVVSPASRRVRRLGLCSSRWFRLARRRITLPVPVSRNRFADPLWVFILGIGRRLRLLRAWWRGVSRAWWRGSSTPPYRGFRVPAALHLLPSSATTSHAWPPGPSAGVCRAGSALGFGLRCALGLCALGPAVGLGGGRGVPRRTLPRRRALVLRGPVGLGLALPAVRADNHDHVAAVLLRLGLDEAEFLDVGGEALQQPEPELGPGLLASPEHDRHLDLVSLPEEPLDVALLRPVIMRVDLGPELDLLDDRLGLVLARLPGLERGLVLELAVVHELGNRWPCRGRDLDQVEVGLLGQPERITQGNDPYLLAVRADEPYLGNPDALVDTGFDADVTSLGFPPPRHPREGVPRPSRGPRSGLVARICE